MDQPRLGRQGESQALPQDRGRHDRRRRADRVVAEAPGAGQGGGAHRPGPRRRAEPQARGRAQVGGARRGGALRRAPGRVPLHPGPDAQQPRPLQPRRRAQDDHPRSRRELEGVGGRQDLHLQAARRGEVPRRHPVQLGRRGGHVLAHHLSAGGHGQHLQGPVRGGREGRGDRPPQRAVRAQGAAAVLPRALHALVDDHLLQEGAGREQPGPAQGDRARHRRLHVQGAQGRREVGDGAEPELLGSGDPVPRRHRAAAHPRVDGPGHRGAHRPGGLLAERLARDAPGGAQAQGHRGDGAVSGRVQLLPGAHQQRAQALQRPPGAPRHQPGGQPAEPDQGVRHPGADHAHALDDPRQRVRHPARPSWRSCRATARTRRRTSPRRRS